MPIMLTWNMQGGQGNMESKWSTLSGVITNPNNYGLTESPTVVFLQECSDVPNATRPAGWAAVPAGLVGVSTMLKNFGSAMRPKNYFVAHHIWGAVNNRVSFSVLMAYPGAVADWTANVRLINPVPAAAGTRPILGVLRNPGLANAATYFTMHAPSGVVVAFSNTYVNGMIGAAIGAGSYVIGGDFNCEPGNLVIAAPNVLSHSGQPTHGQSNYDYFASNNSAAHGTQLANARRIGIMSDHTGVVANF